MHTVACVHASPEHPVPAFPSVEAIWQSQSRSQAASDAVHATLREAIVTGVLEPGVRLAETALAQRFSVSRTPVREALLRLESERLVDRDRRGGLIVGEMTAREILEVYAVREALTGLTASLAAQSATEADIASLRWHIEELRRAAADRDFARMAQVNLRFHESLCRATHNDFLLFVMQQVHDRVRRFPGTTLSYPGRAESMPAAHEELVRAIEERKPELASTLARRRMAAARELRIRMLHGPSEGVELERRRGAPDGPARSAGSRPTRKRANSHGPPATPAARGRRQRQAGSAAGA